MTSEVFQLNAVVSVLTDRLLCPFREYRELLNHMTGRELYLWEIADARVLCAERLVHVFPELADIPPVPEKTDSGNAAKYVRQVGKHLGSITCYTIAPDRVKLAERTLTSALKPG